MTVYGVIIAGWASNSKYAFLGSMRSAAQIVAYEIAMGFALVGVLMAAGSLNLREIVLAQSGGVHQWYLLPLFPLFLVYLISGVAETNRAPFDVAEGESEIVAGFHVEYSGTAFALFFLAEYANMMLISALSAIMFLGGWLSPFDGIVSGKVLAVPVIGAVLGNGMHWLLLKLSSILFCFLWFRATFPRYRYDQIMRLGWKVFIPVTLVWLGVMGGVMFLTPWAAIQTARNAALPASCARRCARRWRSRSNRRCAPTARAAPRVTTSTCSSAFTAGSARNPAPWTPSSRPGFSSFISRTAANT